MDGQELITKLQELPSPREGHPFWASARINLIKWLEGNDPEDFRECPIIKQTMYVATDSDLATYEFDQLPDRYKNTVMIDPATGRYEGNSVHQAYHIYQWELNSGKRVEDLTSIFEFGAGYGELCRIIYQLGYEGSYTIHDFPELELLQQFYLRDQWFRGNVFWEDLEVINSRGLPDSDLFVSLWSLSETPLDVRERYVNFPCRAFLIAYSLEFMGMDNVPFFKTFVQQHNCHTNSIPISQLQNKHRYILGW